MCFAQSDWINFISKRVASVSTAFHHPINNTKSVEFTNPMHFVSAIESCLSMDTLFSHSSILPKWNQLPLKHSPLNTSGETYACDNAFPMVVQIGICVEVCMRYPNQWNKSPRWVNHWMIKKERTEEESGNQFKLVYSPESIYCPLKTQMVLKRPWGDGLSEDEGLLLGLLRGKIKTPHIITFVIVN